MKIALGSDPNAAELKGGVSEELVELGFEVHDLGSDDPVYANVVINVAERVVAGEFDRGIVMCGTGIGASIAANKVVGAYCALVTTEFQAERAALSNNANLIAMGQQITAVMAARRFVRIWLRESDRFDPNGRSGVKVRRISEYEKRRLLQVGREENR